MKYKTANRLLTAIGVLAIIMWIGAVTTALHFIIKYW